MRASPPTDPHQCHGTLCPHSSVPVPPGTQSHPTHGGGISQQTTAKGLRDPLAITGVSPPPPCTTHRTRTSYRHPPAPAGMDPPLPRGSRRDHRLGSHGSPRFAQHRGCRGGSRGRAGAPGRELPLSLRRLWQPSKSFPSPRPPFLPALAAMVHCTSQPSRGGCWITLRITLGSPSGSPSDHLGTIAGHHSLAVEVVQRGTGIRGSLVPSSTRGHWRGFPGSARWDLRGVCGSSVCHGGSCLHPSPKPGSASLRPPRERPGQGTAKGHRIGHRALWPCKGQEQVARLVAGHTQPSPCVPGLAQTPSKEFPVLPVSGSDSIRPHCSPYRPSAASCPSPRHRGCLKRPQGALPSHPRRRDTALSTPLPISPFQVQTRCDNPLLKGRKPG